MRPNSPQQEEGIRIDPPPSVPVAIGVTPAATLAADPPDDPPTVRDRSHGLRVIPDAADSVVGNNPNSGVVVLANGTSPACRYR